MMTAPCTTGAITVSAQASKTSVAWNGGQYCVRVNVEISSHVDRPILLLAPNPRVAPVLPIARCVCTRGQQRVRCSTCASDRIADVGTNVVSTFFLSQSVVKSSTYFDLFQLISDDSDDDFDDDSRFGHRYTDQICMQYNSKFVSYPNLPKNQKTLAIGTKTTLNHEPSVLFCSVSIFNSNQG
jgi:hypothetical protein